MRFATVLSILLILAVVGDASATGIYVRPDGTGDQPTIQAAINAAAPGDTIFLTDGTFTGPGNKNLDYLGKAIVIMPGQESLGKNGGPVIDCEGDGRGFNFSGGEGRDSWLIGITIIHGNVGVGNGGAIRCVMGSSPTIFQCHLEANQANHGGAIYCVQSSPHIANCTILDNTTAAYGGGGGLTLENGSFALVEACRIEGNTGRSTGGVEILEASPALLHCTIVNNEALYANGGGIGCQFGAPLIDHCTIVGNIGHTASDTLPAGGVFLYESAPIIECSVIAFNAPGAGLWCFEDGNAPTISGTDIFGNADGDWIGCIAGMEAINSNLATDPLFCDWENGDYMLQSCSQLVGWSTCDYVGAWDVGCGCSTFTTVGRRETHSWTTLKRLYR